MSQSSGLLLVPVLLTGTWVLVPALLLLTGTWVLVPALLLLTGTWSLVPALLLLAGTRTMMPALLADTWVLVPALTAGKKMLWMDSLELRVEMLAMLPWRWV